MAFGRGETAVSVGKVGRTSLDAPAHVLAGAIAHDINNALTGIFGGLDFARVSAASGQHDRLAEDLQQIREGADRLLALSRLLEARASVTGPPLPTALPTAPQAAPPIAVGASRGRVLVIDDEPTLVELVVQALTGAHDVVTCSSARVGLGRIAAGEHFDAILCDLMLPELDGPAMYEALHAVSPELTRRLVFMTGGAFTPRARAFLEGHPGTTLAKPFGILALREAVAHAVARSRGE